MAGWIQRVGGGRRGGPRIEDHRPILDGGENVDLAQVRGGRCQRIRGEDHQIRPHPLADLPLGALLAVLVGSLDGDRTQRLPGGDPFLGSDLLAGAADPVHGRPGRQQHVRGSDRGVLVEGDAHVAVQSGAGGGDAPAPDGTEVLQMHVTPEPGVDGEDRGDHAQLRHALELVVPHGLGVDHHRAGLEQRWALGADPLDGVHPQLCGGVPVAVRDQLSALLRNGAGELLHLGGGVDRVGAAGVLIPLDRLVGLTHPGGASLPGAVEDHLVAAQA